MEIEFGLAVRFEEFRVPFLRLHLHVSFGEFATLDSHSQSSWLSNQKVALPGDQFGARAVTAKNAKMYITTLRENQ